MIKPSTIWTPLLCFSIFLFNSCSQKDFTEKSVNTLPTATLTVIGDTSSLVAGQDVAFKLVGSDPDGGHTITKLELLDNGAPVVGGVVASDAGTVTDSSLTGGSHSFAARATDSRGAIGMSASLLLRVRTAPSAPTAYVPQLTNYRYSRGVWRTGLYSTNQPAALANLPFYTNAPTITVRFSSTYPDSNGNYVIKAGSTVLATGSVSTPAGQDVLVKLPPGRGTKRVEILPGNTQRDDDDGIIKGVSIEAITVPAGYIGRLSTEPAAARVVGWDGNSISVGYGAASPGAGSTAPLLRTSTQDIQVLNYGSARASLQYSEAYWASTKKAQHGDL
jgi:hypothetical protein